MSLKFSPISRKKRVFIDLGAYNGDSIQTSLDWYRKKFDKIYAFEPRKESFKDLEKKFSGRDNIFLFNAAADTTAGFGKLHKGMDSDALGSSLCSNKINCFKTKTEVVRTLDFSKFILDNFSQKDTIILKIDIEGKEYELLDKMMKDESINYIDEIYCEWHFDKIGMAEDSHLDFLKRLRNLGFKLTGNNRIDEFVNVVKLGKTRLKLEKYIFFYVYSFKIYLKSNFPKLFLRLKQIKIFLLNLKSMNNIGYPPKTKEKTH
jgi:FkbM family methyltransferase